jgi:DinB family protein
MNMAASKQETLDRLTRVSEDLDWVMSRVKPEDELRGRRAGEWNIRQVLAHMVMYEDVYVLPSLERLAAGRDAIDLDVTGTESDIQNPTPNLVGLSAHELHERLGQLEAKRAAIVGAMSEETFATPRMTVWGPKPPRWILEKSFAHCWEHGVTVFYIAHFGPR